MVIRTYGKVQLAEKGDKWDIVAAEPHVCIKLKSLFKSIAQHEVVPFALKNTTDTCQDLLWFMDRYPLEISINDKAKLEHGRDCQVKLINEMESLLLPEYKAKEIKLNNGLLPREYQLVGAELALLKKRMLIGDDLGLGKTLTAILTMLHPGTLPAAVVVQAHLPRQWKAEIERFTNLKVHLVKTRKAYKLPPADVYIFKYTSLSGWVDFFGTGYFKLAVFDECQELRTGSSDKYWASTHLSKGAEYCIGLSATPIYNYGNEIFNVIDAINPLALGSSYDFTREWCGYNGKTVKDPKALGSFLRENFFMLRRSRSDVGRELPEKNIIIHSVPYDIAEADRIEDLARQLAIKVISGSFMERGEAARELDSLVRHSTGVAKAKGVAAFVRILLENNEPVVLAGWHRDVYKIWEKELAEFNPVFYTGSESITQKEKSKQAFINGETNLFIISLRSGIGLDGLQHHCKTVVVGELDWSPKVHDQLVGRVDRDGQPDQVTVYYTVSEDGSDPVIMDILGLKSSQSHGIMNPISELVAQHTDESRIKVLAERYLQKH